MKNSEDARISKNVILVSFCNLNSPESPRLAVFEPLSNSLFPLEVPNVFPVCKGITGLAASDESIYVTSQHSTICPNGLLLVFKRKDFSLVHIYRFQRVKDAHSLCWSNNRLLVVSTGTNEIIEIQLNSGEVTSEIAIWRPDGVCSSCDTYHLNAICDTSGGLVVSAFGKKLGDSWESVKRGFLYNLTQGEVLCSGLFHPHSVNELEQGKLIFCESQKGTVQILNGTQSPDLRGYSRGLCKVGENLFVGISMRRQISRSSGRPIGDGAHVDKGATRCAIANLSARTLRVLSTYYIPLESCEIYDLLPIEYGMDWPLPRAIF